MVNNGAVSFTPDTTDQTVPEGYHDGTGTVMGAIMLGMINNMLVLGGVSSYLQQAAKGFVIIAAVLLQYSKRN